VEVYCLGVLIDLVVLRRRIFGLRVALMALCSMYIGIGTWWTFSAFRRIVCGLRMFWEVLRWWRIDWIVITRLLRSLSCACVSAIGLIGVTIAAGGLCVRLKALFGPHEVLVHLRQVSQSYDLLRDYLVHPFHCSFDSMLPA
jgi:hypothetical protein